MPAARGRRREARGRPPGRRVRDACAAHPARCRLAYQRPPRSARRARDGPRLHDDTLTSPGLDALDQPSRPCRPPLRPAAQDTSRPPPPEGSRRTARVTHTRSDSAAATIHLSHDDYEIDWKSLAFVAVDDAYAGDYEGAVVVDVGAHKGYYGAYALLHGARAVVSYEPESANFALLESSAGVELPGSRRRMGHATVRGRRRTRCGRPPRDGRLVGPRAPSPGARSRRTKSASSTWMSRR